MEKPITLTYQVCLNEIKKELFVDVVVGSFKFPFGGFHSDFIRIAKESIAKAANERFQNGWKWRKDQTIVGEYAVSTDPNDDGKTISVVPF